jgi:ribosome-associated toxin RatA of RatAB toxin-antitoxin module
VHTGNSIIIDAPRKEIFDVVSDIRRWPERLSHIRNLRIVGQDGLREIVEMSGRLGRTTVSWTAACEVDRDQMELRFEHQRKWSKGMTIIWTFTPTRDATRVEVTHSFRFPIPVVAWIAEPVVVRFFGALDTQTLVEFKTLIENRRGTNPGVS